MVDFSGIMSNPTYAKVQEGAALLKINRWTLFWQQGGGSVIDCCKVISAQAKLQEDIWEMEYSSYKIPHRRNSHGRCGNRIRDRSRDERRSCDHL